jgi:phosphatidylglycerophosphatase A
MLNKLIITGGYTGLLPVAPGTWGSLVVAGLFFVAALSCSAWPLCVNAVLLVVAGLASIACVGLGGWTERTFGRKDPGACVIDEWAGQAVTYLLVPTFLPGLATWQAVMISAGVGFAAFRLFDIVKPSPVRRLERLSAGWGVLADDLAAGVYANVLTQLVLRVGLGMVG